MSAGGSRKPACGTVVGPLVCPAWCAQDHDDTDVTHSSDSAGVPASRYPWTQREGDGRRLLLYGSVLVALHQGPHDAPLVHLVDPEDKVVIDLTLDEAEQLATELHRLVGTARAEVRP